MPNDVCVAHRQVLREAQRRALVPAAASVHRPRQRHVRDVVQPTRAVVSPLLCHVVRLRPPGHPLVRVQHLLRHVLPVQRERIGDRGQRVHHAVNALHDLHADGVIPGHGNGRQQLLLPLLQQPSVCVRSTRSRLRISGR